MLLLLRTLVLGSLLFGIGCGPGAHGGAGSPREGGVSSDDSLRRGQIAEKNGQYREALRQYRKAIAEVPNSIEPVRRLARLLIRQKRSQQAVVAARSYGERVPGDPRGYHLLAEAQIAAGGEQDARSTLSEMLEIDDADVVALHMRGELLLRLEKMEAALADLRRAVDLAPDIVRFRLSLGKALRQAKKHGESALHLRAALQVDPTNAKVHLLLGLVLRDQVELKEALSHHLKAALYAPRSAKAHYELGISQWRFRDPLGAKQSFARALTLHRKNPTYLYAYGEVLRALKEWHDAVVAYEEVIALDPDYPDVYARLGVCLFYSRRYREAELALTTASRNRPKDPYPYYNLGNVYEKTQRYRMAMAAFRRFLALAPRQDADIRVARKKISAIRRKIRKANRQR